MRLYDIETETLDGQSGTLGAYAGKVLLAVNVASKCGLTPQYEGLEALYRRYADQGFAVLGFPCNQFGEQEPGTAEEIGRFCSTTYDVTFPMFAKIEVNGPDRHELYRRLVELPDADGEAGDVQWNFEKFLIDADGTPVARFRPGTAPDADQLIAEIEQRLPTASA